MLDALKRLLSRQPLNDVWSDIAKWAKRRQWVFKQVRGGDGFVIDGALGRQPWRLEWGAPQRQYIGGQELRLRMELSLPSDLQMMVLSHDLAEILENSTFTQYTETTQTLANASTPEEMRWLVMYPNVLFKASRPMRSRFNLVSSSPLMASTWFEDELATCIETVGATLLAGDPPFLIMTLRGRVYLRMQLNEPCAAHVASAIGIFESAVTQALRIAHLAGDTRPSGWQHSQAPTAWQTELEMRPTQGTRGRSH